MPQIFAWKILIQNLYCFWELIQYCKHNIEISVRIDIFLHPYWQPWQVPPPDRRPVCRSLKEIVWGFFYVMTPLPAPHIKWRLWDAVESSVIWILWIWIWTLVTTYFFPKIKNHLCGFTVSRKTENSESRPSFQSWRTAFQLWASTTGQEHWRCSCRQNPPSPTDAGIASTSSVTER